MDKDKRGRLRKHHPTETDRELVSKLAGLGISRDQIAASVQKGISVSTLCRHYPEELVKGEAQANTKVAQALFNRASSGKDTNASVWWTKARMKWREVSRSEVTGPDGGPVQFSAIELTVVDPKRVKLGEDKGK